jgi:hypothetical protein
MADLITITGSIARIEFDKVRKLKPRHRFIRAAVITSGKSITELVADYFGGHPYLVQALLAPGLVGTESLTLDDASDLIDQFLDKGGKPEQLRNALVTILASYLHVEVQKTEEEDPAVPNADSPALPGPDAD